MKCGVALLPGSNCDHDVYHVLKHTLGLETMFLWHENETVEDCDLVVVPGGFSYGDYLRSGALAARSPVLAAARRHAEAGGLVLGICNGFQILCEAGLLPGALLRNRTLRFEHRDVCLRVERTDLAFTHRYRQGQVLSIPIAHMDGNYFATEAALDELEAAGRVVFRYVAPDGALDDAWNWNGSARAIAGIVNPGGNVLGMMPHPERAADPLLGSTDGLALFEAAVESLRERLAVAR